MAFLRTRTALPEIPTADAVVSAGLTSAQIDGNFKSLDASKAEVNQTMFIGTTSVAINRGTGALSLTSVSIDGNASTATTLQNARTINGTSFNGSANITTSTWGTARNVTIGAAAAKSVNGSVDVSWTLNEIGAAATNQTMHIGTTSVTINRGSGTLALTGISSITSSTSLNLLTPNTTSANSSDITISSGNTTTSGVSGYVTISSGVTSGSSDSGWVTITSGSTVTGTSGNVLIATATSSSTGGSGNIIIGTGQIKGNKANAGMITILGANSSNTTFSNNGHIYIVAGSATAASGTKYGGKVYIDGGRPAAGGTIVDEGSVLIGTQDNLGSSGTRVINIGHANSTTKITGTVQLPTVGTSGFVKLSANGTLIADTNTYWNTLAGSLVDIYDAGLDNLNNWYLSGFYYFAAGSTNAPTSNEQIVYAAYPGVKTAQISVDASQNGVYTRVYDGNTATWSGWNKLLSTADIAVEDGNSNLQLNSLGVGTTPSTVSGEINASGKITALEFNGVSDAKYKTNVEVIQNGLDIISQINPVSFNWVSNDKKSYGVIAQELEKIIPEAVSTTESGDKTVNYMMIIAFLVSAVQQLSHK